MIEFVPFSAATYWVNYSAHVALACGAALGDVALANRAYFAHVEANRGRFEEAKAVAPLRFDGTPAVVPYDLAELMLAAVPVWCDGWVQEGERLASVAEELLANGHWRTAAGLFRRAAAVIGVAEYSMRVGADKTAAFDRARHLCRTAIELSDARFDEVVIPYEDGALDGMFWPAEGEGPHPTAILFNGLHTSMEWFWQVGLVGELVRRGVSVLAFDCPGSGTARFHKDMHVQPFTERYAHAAVDYVVTRDDVDSARLASIGSSFGGYRCVRAAAKDQRFTVCLAWGALYELPTPAAAGDVPEGVPMAAMNGVDIETLMWCMGIKSADDALALRSNVTLDGLMEELRCHLVVYHGEGDLQVPVSHARRVIGEAVNAQSRELVVLTADEGGEQHCQMDNPETAVGRMADRVAALLGATEPSWPATQRP